MGAVPIGRIRIMIPGLGIGKHPCPTITLDGANSHRGGQGTRDLEESKLRRSFGEDGEPGHARA